MPKPSDHPFMRPRSALFAGVLLLIGCGSSASDPNSQAALGGAPGSAGAAASSGASNIPGAGANSSAGATSSAGAPSTGGALDAAGGGGQPPSAGAAGAVSVAGAAGASSATTSDLWVAPDGIDTNAGSEAAPLRTISYAAVKLTAGSTIWIKAGTYKYTNMISLGKLGTQAKPFTITAGPGARRPPVCGGR